MVQIAGRNRSGGVVTIAGASLALALAGCAGIGPPADSGDIPQATYYTVVVRPGDTLSQLADRYDSSAAEVARLNKLGRESHIRAGEVLRVPVGGAATREAVLSEASSATAHNYAAPPKPINVARFDARERVTVRNLAAAMPQSARPEERVGQHDLQRENPYPNAPLHSADSNTAKHVGEHFAWPVEGQVISPFGRVGNGERNDGINIAASAGTPICAAAAGTVTYVGNELKGYGNLVLIQHDDGYVTAYAHAQSISVARGDRVEKGQIIGLAGATGDVNRPQLHFEIRRGVQPLNPRLMLASKG